MPKACEFYVAWVGKCEAPTVPGANYCSTHAKVKCRVCDKQASHECSETPGPFVCGKPLCKEHECLR